MEGYFCLPSCRGGLRLSGEKPNKGRNVDEPPSFCPEFFFSFFVFSFFLLCYTPGIFQKAPACRKLLAALGVAHQVDLDLWLLSAAVLRSHTSRPARLLLITSRSLKKEPWRRFLRVSVCVCVFSLSWCNSIKCTLLRNWNWHLASHCFYWTALMCVQKARFDRVCLCVLHTCTYTHAWAGALAPRIHVCRYLFDVCPALRGWKVNSLISPWTQLALWLAESRPGLWRLLKGSRPLKVRWKKSEAE